MSETKFSVSMCVYGKDNPAWFDEAVKSICNQTKRPSEVVLVVDGPVPNALDEIIQKYENTNCFNVIRFSENQGHGTARRAGLAACSNELVAIMDADDISVHDRFEKQIAAFEENADVSVVGGQINEFITDVGNIVGKRTVPEKDEQIKAYMKTRCPMNLTTIMFHKTDVEKAGGFIDWYCEEDYYLWLRMAKKNMKFCNVPDTLVNVRVGEDMYQRRGGLQYFLSEAKLQQYMLNENMIGFCTYIGNVLKRFVVQVLLPNKLRGWVFRNFAREKV